MGLHVDHIFMQMQNLQFELNIDSSLHCWLNHNAILAKAFQFELLAHSQAG